MSHAPAPKVSVCVPACNQEPFVRECLQSLVLQAAPFEFEVVVADDSSTDGTREVIREFAARYPRRVRPLFHPHNLGPFATLRAVHLEARGEYVAHVDGDDSALPGKLARQTRFLDEHPDCALVAHRMLVVARDGRPGMTPSHPPRITAEALLRGHPMFQHSSIMYRRDRLRPLFASGEDFIDFRVYVEAALQGDLGFIDEPLGRYRSGLGVSRKRVWMPYIQAAIDAAASKVPDDAIRAARARQFLFYAVGALMEGSDAEFRGHIEQAQAWRPGDPTIALLYWLRAMPSLLKQAVFLRRRLVSLVR